MKYSEFHWTIGVCNFWMNIWPIFLEFATPSSIHPWIHILLFTRLTITYLKDFHVRFSVGSRKVDFCDRWLYPWYLLGFGISCRSQLWNLDKFYGTYGPLNYSGANWKVYKYCFMKQKCQLQMGIAGHFRQGFYTTYSEL